MGERNYECKNIKDGKRCVFDPLQRKVRLFGNAIETLKTFRFPEKMSVLDLGCNRLQNVTLTAGKYLETLILDDNPNLGKVSVIFPRLFYNLHMCSGVPQRNVDFSGSAITSTEFSVTLADWTIETVNSFLDLINRSRRLTHLVLFDYSGHVDDIVSLIYMGCKREIVLNIQYMGAGAHRYLHYTIKTTPRSKICKLICVLPCI